jgi:hypothetical protein
MTDQYLERPYAAQADRDALVERFEESDDYHTALVEWVLSDDHTRDRFQATSEFDRALDDWCDRGDDA